MLNLGIAKSYLLHLITKHGPHNNKHRPPNNWSFGTLLSPFNTQRKTETYFFHFYILKCNQQQKNMSLSTLMNAEYMLTDSFSRKMTNLYIRCRKHNNNKKCIGIFLIIQNTFKLCLWVESCLE